MVFGQVVIIVALIPKLPCKYFRLRYCLAHLSATQNERSYNGNGLQVPFVLELLFTSLKGSVVSELSLYDSENLNAFFLLEKFPDRMTGILKMRYLKSCESLLVFLNLNFILTTKSQKKFRGYFGFMNGLISCLFIKIVQNLNYFLIFLK